MSFSLAAELRQAIDELDDMIGEARAAVFPAALDPEGGSLTPRDHHRTHTRR